MKLWLGPTEITAELALTPIQQQTGEMFLDEPGAERGDALPAALHDGGLVLDDQLSVGAFGGVH